MTIYDTAECVTAFKKWIDAHPDQAALLFASPDEYQDHVQYAEDGEHEFDCMLDAEDTRRKLLRSLKSITRPERV